MAGLYDGISAYFTARNAQKAKVKEARNELSDINTQLVNLRKRYMALPYSDPEKAELSAQIQELSTRQKDAQTNLDNEKVQLKTVDSTSLGEGSTLGEYGAKADAALNKGVAKAWDNTKEVAKNVGQGIKDSTKYIGSSIGDAVNASLNKTTDPRSKGERAQADIADQNAADEQKAAQREAQEGNRDERDVAAQDAAARQAQKAEAVQHQLGASAGAGAAALAGAEAVMGENMNIEQQRNYQAGRRDTGYQHQAAQRSAQAGAAALRGGADARDVFASELSNENAKRSMLTSGYYDEAPTSKPQDTLPKTSETPKTPETPTPKEPEAKKETVVEDKSNSTETPSNNSLDKTEGTGYGIESKREASMQDATITAKEAGLPKNKDVPETDTLGEHGANNSQAQQISKVNVLGSDSDIAGNDRVLTPEEQDPTAHTKTSRYYGLHPDYNRRVEWDASGEVVYPPDIADRLEYKSGNWYTGAGTLFDKVNEVQKPDRKKDATPVNQNVLDGVSQKY